MSFARSLIPALAAASVLASPACAEIAEKSDSGFVVREVAEVPTDAAATWGALIAPAKWWSDEHTWSGKAANLYLDAQASGCFCELLPLPEGMPEGTRRGSVQHMRVIYVSPFKILRMSGALGPLQSEAVNGTLTITLKPTDKGTRILWEYVVGGYMRYKVEEIAPAVDKVLAEQIGGLAKVLAAEPATDASKGAADDTARPAGKPAAAPTKPKPSAKKPAPKKPASD